MMYLRIMGKCKCGCNCPHYLTFKSKLLHVYLFDDYGTKFISVRIGKTVYKYGTQGVGFMKFKLKEV